MYNKCTDPNLNDLPDIIAFVLIVVNVIPFFLLLLITVGFYTLQIIVFLMSSEMVKLFDFFQEQEFR
ncbi:Hypothetical protein HVR_LOCUS809 [uncultured virus]|nr:Hypothetical protein HVR_LOCUS809 [uncultured virus]